MIKSFNYGLLIDYVTKNFPNTLWWDNYNKHETFKAHKSYKHRAGMPNEIRIEFDSEDSNKNWENINFTAIRLLEFGYSFAIYYVEGGRSPHIHIYDLDELEQLDIEQRKKYRELFLNKICPRESSPDLALCDEKHLCALEFANHFKYNKPKELLCMLGNGSTGGIDIDLKIRILQDEKPKPQKRKPTVKLGETLRDKTRNIIIKELDFEKVFDKYGVKYRGHMAVCPFHPDSDGSLSFSNEKGLWKCFGSGCEAKGDIITMIKMLKERENGVKK